MNDHRVFNTISIACSASGAITAYPASFGNSPSVVSSFRKLRPSASAE